MKDVCFFTVYDRVYKNIGKGCVNSVKRFYPEIDFIEYEIERNAEFDLKFFCKFHLEKGLELLKEYKRVISVDADHIMCNFCSELFEDYDFGIVPNNMNFFTDSYPIYMNAGLTICTNDWLWEEWYNKFMFYYQEWNDYTEQNTLNDLYYQYKDKYNFKVLDPVNKSYGVKDIDGYPSMTYVNGELYIVDKKVCMLHMAGKDWIDDLGNILWDRFLNEGTRQKLQFLIQ